MPRILSLICASACAIALVGASNANAQTVVGEDDFGTSFDMDGSNTPIGGNQVFKSRILMPDNQSNTGFNGAPGTFGGSFFDYFGITDRTLNRELADDSDPAGPDPFEIDSFGFAGRPGGPNDFGNFLAMADITNDDNPFGGFVSADWEFDTSVVVGDPYDIHRISIDAIAYGDFESDTFAGPPAEPQDPDEVEFSVQLDEGTPKAIWDISLTAADDAANVLYEVTMEGGASYGKFKDPFYDNDEWLCLVNDGPGFCAATGNVVAYHPSDDGGPNDDGIAFNGEILVPVLGDPTNTERAYQVTNGAGTFNQTDFRPYQDPLTEQNSGTQLNNQKKRLTALCKGAADCLTLSMIATQNSGTEIIAFDNLLVESAVLGDANGDGRLTNADIDPFLLALFNPPVYEAIFPGIDPDFVCDFNCDGGITNADIDGFIAKLFGF